MNLHKLLLCSALLLSLFSSCREDSDFLASYAGSDTLVMKEAGSSFHAQFEAIWKAVNCNYVSWEIEPVDWDAVYDEYYPKFEELDALVANGESVTDEQLTEMYHAVLDTLHDGHAYYAIKNPSTKHYIKIFPAKARNMRRFGEDYSKKTAPIGMDFKYYTSALVPESERFVHGSIASTSGIDFVKNNLRLGMQKLQTAIQNAQSEKESEELTIQYNALDTLLNKDVDELKKKGESAVINAYNKNAASYHDAHMPQYETVLEETERISVISGLTNDGIAYLRFSSFMFSHYLTLTEEDLLEMEMEGYEYDASNIRHLISTWKLWFDGIQALHASGKLKGVIIDVRGNNGGLNNDNRYVVGALLPSGGHKVGTYKMKTGTGRLDYSIDFDFNIPTRDDDEHAIIDDVPIVALCDHTSVSNAEMTSIAVKQLPNGYVVGSQTHGGMSSLITGWSTYSYTYSGEFGVSDSPPIYGYQPISMINYTGYGVLEGIGVTPDCSLEYDPVKVADPTDPSIIYTVDNQLEAALKYIRR